MFDLLVSADVLVDDHDQVLGRLSQLAVPPSSPRATVMPDGWNTRWTFAWVSRDRFRAPTRLEVIAPLAPVAPERPAPNYPFIEEIATSQGPRPSKLHSTVIAVSDIERLVTRLEDRRLPHRLFGADGHLPFPRLWLGFESGEGDTYVPTVDGGLRIEVLPYAPLGIPTDDSAFRAGPVDETNLIRRIESRLILVTDLDETLSHLASSLDWTPDEVVLPADGTRRARFVFSHPYSASLELVEATGRSGRAGTYQRQWGSGPYAIRLQVTSLDDARRILTDRGTPLETAEADDGTGRACLVVPLDFGLGSLFELVEEG
jgi:hypothetical protein